MLESFVQLKILKLTGK